MPTDFLEKNIPDLKILSVSPADKILSYQVSKLSASKLKMDLVFTEDSKAESIELQFTKDSSKENADFVFDFSPTTVVIQRIHQVSPEALKMMADLGYTISQMNKYTEPATYASTVIVSFLGLDVSGDLLKFSLM